jgi:hypothetical protein
VIAAKRRKQGLNAEVGDTEVTEGKSFVAGSEAEKRRDNFKNPTLKNRAGAELVIARLGAERAPAATR